jgi:hypothetical protein
MSLDRKWQKYWLEHRIMVRVDEPHRKPMRLDDLHKGTIHGQRSEDYAIAIGLQMLAEERGLAFVMATVTLPGEWSPVVSKGRKSAYNGASPYDANRELKARLKLIRTNLVDTLDVAIGFVVTEPQKTGSPHCHFMLLTDDADRAEKIILGYKEDEDHQIDVRRWHLDPTQSKAASIASYLTKYLMKGKDLDEQSEESIAWSAWRRGCAARTTSFFGLGKGFKGRWRAVYRSDVHLDYVVEEEGFCRIKAAMNASNWGKALAIVAGLDDEVHLEWQTVTEERVNRYGETVVVVTDFVLSTGEILPLRSGEYEMIELEDADDQAEPSVDDRESEIPVEFELA